jgi:hypothetical protein
LALVPHGAVAGRDLGVESLASNGYEVDPHRISSESTYNEYLAKADNTDFVFTFSQKSGGLGSCLRF